MLQGTVGQGKSVFMRFMTSQEIRKGERIPIFFELRNLGKNESLNQALIATLNKWLFEIDNQLFKVLAESGKLVFFLDGFDEIPTEQVKDIIRELEQWSEQYSQLQIIVSSRPDSGIEASSYFNVFELCAYDLDDQLGLIKKLVEEEESFLQIKKALEASSLDIQNLLKTPLMVTLFVMTYRAKQTIPESMSDFYEDIFQVLMYRHDKTKPGYIRELKSDLNEKQLQEIFEYFSFLTKKENILSFKRQKFIDLINISLNKTNHTQQDPSKVVQDITKALCLIIQDGPEFHFIHKSIQEFFVANFIRKLPEKSSYKIYNHMIQNYESFKFELIFLSEIDKYKYYKFFILPQLNSFLLQFNSLKNNDITDLLNNCYIEKIRHRGEYDERRLTLLTKDKDFRMTSWLFEKLIFTIASPTTTDNSYKIRSFSLNHLKYVTSINADDITEEIRSNEAFKRALHEFMDLLNVLKSDADKYVSLKEDSSILNDF